jgi:hypothetical protein
MMNSRERKIKRALTLLGKTRFLEFIFAAASHGCRAVELFINEIEKGIELEEIFFTGKEFGYHLHAKALGAARFSIEFSCQAGPLAGDGGEWDISFNKDGSFLTISQLTQWIS